MKHRCDHECAEANNCQVGGIRCEWCHGYFCANDLGEYNGMYVCDDCRTEIEELEAEEEEGGE
jgi:hypothetical protein